MRNLLFLILIMPSVAFSAELSLEKVKEAISKDNISLQDCRKWYTVYHGSYLYVKEFDAEGSKDFGDIADRMRIIRDKIVPSKGAKNFGMSIDEVMSKYADKDFTPENKTDYAEELYVVTQALKSRIGELQ